MQIISLDGESVSSIVCDQLFIYGNRRGVAELMTIDEFIESTHDKLVLKLAEPISVR